MDNKKHIYLTGVADISSTIELARYAFVLARLGAKITAEAPKPIVELLNASGHVTWVAQSNVTSTTDNVQKITELPKLLGTHTEIIPFPKGYLQADSDKREKWRQRWENENLVTIGLSWELDSLAEILPLIPEGIKLVILDSDVNDTDMALLNTSHQFECPRELTQDYHELAAAISWLDGVVSSNSLISNLSKALGRPTWEINPDLRTTLELIIKNNSNLSELDEESLIFKTQKYRTHFDFINYCIVKLMNNKKYYRALEIINNNFNNLESHGQIYNTCLAYSALSRLYQKYEYLEKAIELGNQAIHYLPNNKKMILNLGKSYSDLNETIKSQVLNKKAIKLDQDYALAKVNYSIELLKMGNYKKGFEYYQARWDMEDFKKREGLENYKKYTLISNCNKYSCDISQLNLAGKKLLIIDEQGLGDSIMLVRLIKQIKDQGATIYFSTQATLFRLFQNMETIDQIYLKNRDYPEADYACFLWDLPYLLRLDIDSIPNNTPNNTPYLFIEHKKIKSNKIGLCWRGNQKHTNDFLRSIPLEKLITGLSKNKKYISLQLAMHPLEYELLEKANIEKISDNINDFYDTACLINSLDLIITIDSSIAHIAGALNIPTIVLLPYSADWRWGLNRSDSPWYPSITLIRQPAYGDWDSVMHELKARIS